MSEPVLTGAHPFLMCICLQCGPPFRDQVPDWNTRGWMGSWMALCPTCGSKRCSGAWDHTEHADAPS